MASLAAPELGAEVEIVGDDRAGFVGGFDGFGDDLARAFGEGGEDAAGVEPADAVFVEEFFQFDVAGLHAGGGGVAAVVERDAAALGDADFGEVQADAVVLADAVVFALDDVGDIHADGAGVVADDRAHRRGIEPADPAGAQAEAREGVGDVVFAAADPDFEQRGEFDAAMLRRGEADHAFAEADQIETAIFGVTNFHILIFLDRERTLKTA